MQCALWLIATSNINIIIRIQNNSCPVTRLRSNCVLLLFLLASVSSGDGGNYFRFRRFLLPFLCRQSLIPSICFCCSAFFFYSFQVSFITILPSQRRSPSLSFSLRCLGVCSLFQFFIFFPHDRPIVIYYSLISF